MHKPDAWCMRHTLLNKGSGGSGRHAESSTIGCQQGRSPAAGFGRRCGLLDSRLLNCGSAGRVVVPVQTRAQPHCVQLLGGCSCTRLRRFSEYYLSAEVRCLTLCETTCIPVKNFACTSWLWDVVLACS